MLLPETVKLHSPEFEFHCIYFLPWKNQMVAALEEAGAKVTCLPAQNNWQLMGQWRKVEKYILDHNIDLVHAHLPWAGFLARVIHRKLRIPVIYTEHNKQERYHRLTYWLNKWTFGWQSGVIAVSQDVAQSIHTHIRPTVPVFTILNGVNTDFYRRELADTESLRASLGIDSHAWVVGTVAVFRFQKRLKEWLRIFAEAHRHDARLRGIIVGAGPLEEEIKAERAALGLERVVHMPGLQTNTRDWYGLMDVCMLSSEFEGLPIALLEAMSMECAIVATRAGGIGEVVEEGKSGLLVEVDQWQDLSPCLLRMQDLSYRQSMAQAARERVVAAFSLERMVQELEERYRRSVDNWRVRF
jgi:L-malate glycosyltransferase